MKVPVVFEKKVLIWGVCSHLGDAQTLFETARETCSFWTPHTPNRDELGGWLVLEAGMMRLSVPAAVTSDRSQRPWAVMLALGRPGMMTRYSGSGVSLLSQLALGPAAWRRCYWTLCTRRCADAVLLCTLFQRVNETRSGCLLDILKGRVGRGIRLLLMLQCYKFNGETDSLTSWCKYSFPLKKQNKTFNENKKVQPKLLHSLFS